MNWKFDTFTFFSFPYIFTEVKSSLPCKTLFIECTHTVQTVTNLALCEGGEAELLMVEVIFVCSDLVWTWLHLALEPRYTYLF